jgi:phosphoglycerate dehydrogenase-like enzyme
MTNVLLLLNMPEEVRTQYRDRLRAAFPQVRVDLVDHFSKVDPYIADIEVLITFAPMLRDEVLRRAAKLKWVQALGTGVDNLIDLPSLCPDVAITNIRGIHGPPLSESAICSMLALSRRLPRSIRSQDQRKWDRWASALIDGKTVGIFGIGAIAADLAPKCKALGTRVVGISSAPGRAVAGFDEMRSRDDLAKAVADLDVLVLLTPLTPQTRHIVDAKVFAAMKPTSFLVNLARGGVVDESDLIEALEQGRIAGAALDVFEQEPLPPEHALWSAKNVIITPHLGGFNESYVDRAMPAIAHNMTCFIAGKMDDMINIVPR